MRVLVVEDDEAIRQLVEMTLELEGHEVTTAADGRAALAVLDAAAPDVVVTDVMMPGMNGWELLAVLRADPVRLALPVLLLTARGVPDDVRRGRELGASALLDKPFEIDELLAVVAALAGGDKGTAG